MTQADSSEQQPSQHAPVLLTESIDGLAVRSDGIYIDCTFGRGGHSSEILKRLGDSGKLLAIDKDEAALASDNCQQLREDPRFDIEHGSYAELNRFINQRNWIGQVG